MTMFDRDTRREKVLENMAKEARIKAASISSKGMKSAVISIKMKSMMVKDGFSGLKQKVQGKTNKFKLQSTIQLKVCKVLYGNVCFFDRSIKVVVMYLWRSHIAIYTVYLRPEV